MPAYPQFLYEVESPLNWDADYSYLEYEFCKIDNEHEQVIALWQAHLEFITPSDFGTPDEGEGVLV